MSTTREPNPPSRREEDFPKTTTIPDGWIMDALMEVYNNSGSVSDEKVTTLDQHTIPVPATGTTNGKVNGKSHAVEAETRQEIGATPTESLFARRLDPFPSASDLSGIWL